jgi:Flp pilus assembly protein TadG
MHKKKLAVLAFAVILVTLLVSLYFFNIYGTPGNTVKSSVENDGLQVSLTLNSKTTTYKQGAEIYVTVTLTNTGHKALTVFSNNAFNNSYLYDAYLGFDVRNSENDSVWTETGTGNYNGTVTLDPQKSVNDTFNWNTGSYRSTPQASTGVYQLAGFYETDNNLIATSRLQTAPLNISIVKGS